jgi:hypothetical protein
MLVESPLKLQQKIWQFPLLALISAETPSLGWGLYIIGHEGHTDITELCMPWNWKDLRSWIDQAALPPRGNILLEMVKIAVPTDIHTYLNCLVITDCFWQVLPSSIHCTSLHLAEGFNSCMGTEFLLLLFYMHRITEVSCLSKLSSVTSQIAIDFFSSFQ